MDNTSDRESILHRLWERLEPLRSERVVLSAAYRRRDDGSFELRYGSLLLGPAAMAMVGWSDWQRRHLVSEAGLLPQGDPAVFVHDGGTWLAGRAVLTLPGARRWLANVLLDGVASHVGALPAAEARVAMPASPVLARYPNETTASRYVLNTVRSVHGYFFPASGDAGLELPQWWPADDPGVVVPPATPLGIDLPTEGQTVPSTDPGLFVGRVSRTAWINSVRFAKDKDEFTVGIWLEPKRADLHGLVLEVREYVQGELAFAARIPLADLYIPARARGKLWISLPTLGPELQRSVSLYDRDGTLLDHYERFALVEKIHFTLKVNGGETTFVVGDQRAPTLIEERLRAFDRIEVQYRELLRSGMRRRVVETREAAIRYLRQRLSRIRDELLILDPYFGKDPSDWQILDGVTVPVQILRDPERVAVPASLANVEIRRFVAQRQPVPFHDRLYIWGDTGLSVGASPNGFGNRVFRIDEIGSLESEVWRTLFERWWASQHFRP
jgi:hypothetical protein